MKQDKILSFSIVLLLLLSGKSWSQSNMNFGVNAATGSKWFLPNGKRGLGASVEYVDMLLKHGTIRVNLGYDWFERRFPGVSETKKQDSIRVLGINGYNISFIPIRIGYQHFLFKDAAFVYAETGIARLITRYSNADSRDLFTYALGTGYRFPIKAQQYLQLSFTYNYNRLNKFRNLNYFAFRTAYGLGFRKENK